MFKAYRDIGLAVIAAKGDDLGGGEYLCEALYLCYLSNI